MAPSVFGPDAEPLRRPFADPVMHTTLPRFAPLLSIALLAACSPQGAPPANDATANVAVEDAAPADAGNSAAANTDAPAANAAAPAASATTLTLDGLGDLVVGKPVPKGSSFTPHDVQISDTCTLLNSRDYPGVYAIASKGQVRRVTVSEGSSVALVEGIRVGSPLAEVTKAFPGFRSSPHKYVNAPGQYLTQPGDDPRLRFEIGEDGKVTSIHVGLMPQLAYVEGCA